MRRDIASNTQPSLFRDISPRAQDTNDEVPTLPNELWLYIAKFVPPRDRPKLLGINRLLFELIISEIYRQVDFVTWNPRVLCDQLRSLQSPSLSKRVRVLKLRPESIKAAIRTKVELKDRLARYVFQGRAYVEELLNHAPSTSLPIPSTVLRVDLPLLSPKQRIEMFLSIIPNFTDIESFTVNWLSGPIHPRYARMTSFFPEIWRTVGSNLLSLSIDICAAEIEEAVKPLPMLEELNLTVRFGDPVNGVDTHDARVSFFVNNFAATLQCLSIKTHGRHHDLSDIFEHLEPFPKLSKLLLNMTLDTLDLRDTSGLRQFLRSHQNIEHFGIRYKTCSCLVQSVHDGFSDSSDGKHAVFGDVNLPAMHTLELGLTLSPSNKTTQILYKNLARLGNNVTTLILQDRIMEFDEIKTMLKIFPSHWLKKLMLMARVLSPQLIDYLADACSALEWLSLHAELVVESDAFTRPTYNDAWVISDWFGFEHALTECVDLNFERYTTWALSDVSIMRWKQGTLAHVYDWKSMSLIADAVPSVCSFAGRGHMIPDVSNIRRDGKFDFRVETLLDLDALDWYRGPRWLI